MLELVLIYKWSIVAGSIVAACLAIVGAQLSARNQALSSLVTSQSSAFGITVGLSILASFHIHGLSFLPGLCAVLFALLSNNIEKKLIKVNSQAPYSFHIALFSILMALNYLLMNLVPSVESHVAASYIGDLTLSSDPESITIGIISILFLAYCLKAWNFITRHSFNLSTYTSFLPSKKDLLHHKIFSIMSIIVIALSVQLMGLLFTLSALFLPITILSHSKISLPRMPYVLAITAATSCTVGFSTSLVFEKFSTVPLISIVIALSSALSLVIHKASRNNG
jgi:zinc/manganese transport system permease protein/iron/zinc/copper transport system permease protein